MIKTTSLAKSHLIQILRRHESKYMKFSVRGGGCNGFNYHLEPTSSPPEKLDEVVPIDEERSLIVCGSSVFHLLGVEIDYKETIMGKGFEFTNPNASGKCGCGKSFN